jgi:large conductance mechanosensitive channel
VLKSFRAFIMRGNVIDLAVGVVIGIAFGAVVNSLVKDIIMPPIGLLLGRVDFSNLFVVLREGAVAGPYASLAVAQEAGAVTISYGAFINTLVNFVIIAAVIFFLVVRPIAKMNAALKPPAAPKPKTKECPYCLSSIPAKATRCPNCTSRLQLKKA